MNIWGISFVATAIAGACMAIGYLAGRTVTKTPIIVISERDVEELRKKWCDDTDELKM
nr:MAG TPA: hypothetical protein [Caudoviricetes sp.]